MACPVVPAFIPSSREEVISMTKMLDFASELQIDVVDGVFVNEKSWPYLTADKPVSIKSHIDTFTIEVDLMVDEPLLAARDWVEAGADMLVFHIESVSLEALKNFTGHTTASIGVSMSGNTSLETFLPYVAIADYVQLMGIHEIGKQGQPFNEQVLEIIQAIKKEFPEKLISIDGSVNEETVTLLRDAGAERFVSGSAIVKSNAPKDSYNSLCKRVNG